DYEFVKDSGDLDECNGRFGATPEFPQGIYHYYITEEFPYISRLWRGTPDPSFFKRGPGPGGRGPRGTGFRSLPPGPPDVPTPQPRSAILEKRTSATDTLPASTDYRFALRDAGG